MFNAPLFSVPPGATQPAWPRSLETIRTGADFRLAIDKATWQKGMVPLSFGHSFDEPVTHNKGSGELVLLKRLELETCSSSLFCRRVCFAAEIGQPLSRQGLQPAREQR